MIKRLLVIGFFTGFAHIATLFSLKRIIAVSSSTVVTELGQIDAWINFLISFLGAGLVMTTVRDIAVRDDWQYEYKASIQARFTLSLFLLPLGFLCFYETYFAVFFGAPLIALYGDYGLYGRDKAMTASFLTFLRVLVPALFLLYASVTTVSGIGMIYSALSIVMFLLLGVVIARLLGTSFYAGVSISSLRQYIHSIYLGIVAFGYYFLGLGLVAIAPLFYSTEAVALSYIAIKIYVIYKGLLRIIVQAFVSKMYEEEVCKKVDHLSAIAGAGFLCAAVFFPLGFIHLFIGSAEVSSTGWVLIVGITGFLISVLLSLTTKTMFKKMDRGYAMVSVSGMAAAVAGSILFSIVDDRAEAVLAGLFFGELVSVLGLVILLRKAGVLYRDRLFFFLKIIPFGLIPAGARMIGGDQTWVMIGAIGLFCVLALFLHRKRFSLNFVK